MKKEKFITEIIEIAENAGIEFDQLDEEEPPMSNTKFARKMFELATEAAKTFKINAAIVAAQAVLESGYGRSLLCRKANNLFGIKAFSSWKGPKYAIKTREWDANKGMYVIKAQFRQYRNWGESIEDLGEIIGRLSWYADAAANCDDPMKYLEGILPTEREPGWATDPHYREKILNIARKFGWME